MGVDERIIETGQAILEALNSSQLTLKIMELILKDILHDIQNQQQVEMVRQAQEKERQAQAPEGADTGPDPGTGQEADTGQDPGAGQEADTGQAGKEAVNGSR